MFIRNINKPFLALLNIAYIRFIKIISTFLYSINSIT